MSTRTSFALWVSLSYTLVAPLKLEELYHFPLLHVAKHSYSEEIAGSREKGGERFDELDDTSGRHTVSDNFLFFSFVAATYFIVGR